MTIHEVPAPIRSGGGEPAAGTHVRELKALIDDEARLKSLDITMAHTPPPVRLRLSGGRPYPDAA